MSKDFREMSYIGSMSKDYVQVSMSEGISKELEGMSKGVVRENIQGYKGYVQGSNSAKCPRR